MIAGNAEIHFSAPFRESVKNFDLFVLQLLQENFIAPLLNGNPIEHLEGKVKPSWAIRNTNTSSARLALAQVAKEHNLYHYHFGFPRYSEGRDADYPGCESAGILHFGDWEIKGKRTFVLLRLDLEHPTPFSVPVDFRL